MNSIRFRAASVELNGEMYVIGGVPFGTKRGPYLPQSSVEKYNPVTNSWIQVASLKEARYSHCAGVFNGKIYVIGGFADAVEIYYPRTNAWKSMPAKIPNIDHYKSFIAFNHVIT